jgi:hypothetical protein
MKRINTMLSVNLILGGLVFLAIGCSSPPDPCEEIEKKYESLHREYSTIPDTEEVYETCKNDLRKCPKLSIIYELMARIDYDEEYHEDALKNYRMAFQLNPDNLLVKQKIDDIRAMIRDEQKRQREQARIEREEDERFRRETVARERELETEAQREERLERDEQRRIEQEERRERAAEERRKREAARNRRKDRTTSGTGGANM